MNDLNWFAIQTKPHQERLAAEHVAQLDIEVFLPQFRQEKEICGVERLVTKALFPGYIFARFCPLLSYDPVRYSPGILRVVGSRQSPIPIDGRIIDSIRNRVELDGFVRYESRAYHPNETVSIQHGPFVGWMARVEREWDDGKRVLILLDAMQQARVLIEGRWLAPVSI